MPVRYTKKGAQRGGRQVKDWEVLACAKDGDAAWDRDGGPDAAGIEFKAGPADAGRCCKVEGVGTAAPVKTVEEGACICGDWGGFVADALRLDIN
jgi:hypothetical protein